MHPASPGNPPASPTGTRNPADILADILAALPAAFEDEPPCDAVDVLPARSAIECCRTHVADLDAAVAAALDARLAASERLARYLPASDRAPWPREAVRFYREAAAESARLARLTDAAFGKSLDALNALADILPGSPRWTRTAAALRDAADAEGFDFDAYGDTALDGYSGRGMFGREVPALTLDDGREADAVAHAFRKATGVRASVDSLGRSFVVYPSRLVD